jgi:hypothetical protein
LTSFIFGKKTVGLPRRVSAKDHTFTSKNMCKVKLQNCFISRHIGNGVIDDIQSFALKLIFKNRSKNELFNLCILSVCSEVNVINIY